MIAVALSAPAAWAQPSSPPSSTPAPPGPLPPSAPTPPELIAPPAKTLGAVPQTGTTGAGVIRPPTGVDPGIQTNVPAPHPNDMPVIPPPGAPGGNPSVQPK